MKLVGVVVAEGTAAGACWVRGLTEELEPAELEVAVLVELDGADEAELLAPDMVPVAIELLDMVLLDMVLLAMELDDEA